jgi:hypothetical protein
MWFIPECGILILSGAVPLDMRLSALQTAIFEAKMTGFMKKTRCFINKYGIFWGLYLCAQRISIYLFTCLE